MNKKILLVLAVAIVAILVWKMTSSGSNDENVNLGRKGKTATTETINIDGSNTMVHLVTEWSQAYMLKHPEIKIIVTGNGSGTGLASLIQGNIHLCASSRPIKPKEVEDAKKKNIIPVEFAVAKDAISIIINPGNPLNELTMEQLKKLYTGSIADWKMLAGNNVKVQPLSRESSSGTYEYFMEHVLKKEDFAKRTMMLPATSGVISTVAADNGAIGYVGIGYAHEAADKVKIVAIKQDADSPAIAPSEKSVLDGSYPISRDLYFYADGNPTGAVKDFVDFCLSPEGQDLVEKAGFVAIKRD